MYLIVKMTSERLLLQLCVVMDVMLEMVTLWYKVSGYRDTSRNLSFAFLTVIENRQMIDTDIWFGNVSITTSLKITGVLGSDSTVWGRRQGYTLEKVQFTIPLLDH